ncbi:MAG: MBL fold metallo-hydrolase [Anaerolineae bacterium]|nr:MBL fold metallo-hydrolase [Anaerolineae bacterium]MDW8102539.1 MBL fold metallo-hydrolase [Anaerolineae bacterium]
MSDRARIVFLGSAASLASAEADSFYMALVEPGGGIFLLDCGGSPIHKLLKAGLSPLFLQGILLSHHHPDHLYGLPYLIQGLWLMGRREPLPIWAMPEGCDAVRKLMEVWDWSAFRGFRGVECHPIEPREMAKVLESEAFEITASPVDHLIPSLAFRIRSKLSGKAVVCSGDTAPSEKVVRLAEKAFILVHESTGLFPGHSSAYQAGEIARKSQVSLLILAHFNPMMDPEELVEEAQRAFNGPVKLASDGDVYEF